MGWVYSSNHAACKLFFVPFDVAVVMLRLISFLWNDDSVVNLTLVGMGRIEKTMQGALW